MNYAKTVLRQEAERLLAAIPRFRGFAKSCGRNADPRNRYLKLVARDEKRLDDIREFLNEDSEYHITFGDMDREYPVFFAWNDVGALALTELFLHMCMDYQSIRTEGGIEFRCHLGCDDSATIMWWLENCCPSHINYE